MTPLRMTIVISNIFIRMYNIFFGLFHTIVISYKFTYSYLGLIKWMQYETRIILHVYKYFSANTC